MDRRMAACTPTGALAQKLRVRLKSNIDLPCGTLYLRMTFQAKIRITLHQQLPIHRTVRVVANRAAFSQSLMFKNKWPGLFTMTFGAIPVEPRHCQPPRRFQNIEPVWIMTIHAIHPPLDDRMMLWQAEFGMGLKMALKTGGRLFSGIDDELAAPAPGLNVFAARTMA